MPYKGRMRELYCPLCEKLESMEDELRPWLIKLKEFKRMEAQHKRCVKCYMLLGKGHVETTAMTFRNKTYCVSCFENIGNQGQGENTAQEDTETQAES